MPALGPPEALSPQEWGAQIQYDAWRDLFSPDDGVALHHGGPSDYLAGQQPYARNKEKAQLRSWENYHLSRGWRGLAYGWGVGQTGTIYRIRGWATYGAHSGDIDGDGIANNAEIVPIIFIGSGNHHDLSPAAQDAIESLRRFIEEGSPQATWLYGHQEISPATGTTCPGPKGMAYVTAHRELENDMPLTDDDLAKIQNVFLTAPIGRSTLTLAQHIQNTHSYAKSTWGKLKGADFDQVDEPALVAAVVDALEEDGIARATADEIDRRNRQRLG